MKIILAIIATLSITAPAWSSFPDAMLGQLPPGYTVIASARLAAGKPLRSFEIVVLGRKDEVGVQQSDRRAPARPLLIFERRDGRYVLAARNDHVVLTADEGGQCDPFLDGDAKIAIKGRYFTVENGVACGQHWTDYITFRLNAGTGGFVFDSERLEDWELNPSNDPGAEALVRAGPPRVIRDRPGHVTTFASWRPKR